MDFKANRSDEEDRVMQRQLYRPGQKSEPAAKTSAPTPAASMFKSPPPAKAKSAPKSKSGQSSPGPNILLMILLLGVGYYLLQGTPSQRKKALVALGVAVWLLMLGTISYCLFLPDLDDLRNERRALFENKSLSPEERKEKFAELREREKNLTPNQRKQMREMDFKEMTRKRNKDVFDFLKLSPEEQVAYLKKQAEERQKRMEEFRKMFGDKGPGNKDRGKGNNGNNNGGKGNGGPNGGGGNGGGPQGGGWAGGGGGGGGGNPSQFLDRSSPESRAGGNYQRALSAQLNLGGGGRGGGGGGGGGGPRGGR